MRIVAALFRFSPRHCPSAHNSFTLKGSRVATKGRSFFVFSNVPHCIAFAGSSKLVESCKMKLRASLIRKLGKEVVYIPSFSSLFMREKKWRNCVQTGIRVRWFWKLRRIQESCRRLRFTSRRQFSSWDCFRLYSMEVVKFIIEFYRPWNSHHYSVSPSIFRIASGNLACAPKMYVLIFLSIFLSVLSKVCRVKNKSFYSHQSFL